MPYREFTDAAGAVWRAWDTYPASASNVRAIYAGGWLGFENGSERRRLRPVPAGWADASDGELERWLADAAPIALHQTETYLSAVRPAPAAEPAPDSSAEDDSQAALRQATHSVVERARAVLQMVSQTLSRGD
jgi:hypothetical protein